MLFSLLYRFMIGDTLGRFKSSKESSKHSSPSVNELGDSEALDLFSS